MPFYHARMKYIDANQGIEITDYQLDLSEEETKLFGADYDKGRVFFKGKWIHVSSIEEIEIRETPYQSTDYFGGGLSEARIFDSGRFPHVTRKFIKSPPKKEGVPKDFFPEAKQPSKTIFIVHGRDKVPALELARIVEAIPYKSCLSGRRSPQRQNPYRKIGGAF